MTDAERQKKRRDRLKAESKHSLLVRGPKGEFDERIRTALAVKKLAEEDRIPKEILELIISTSGFIFGDEDILTQKYIKKIVKEYLSTNKQEKDNE